MSNTTNYAAHIARICKIEDIKIGSSSRRGRANHRKRLIKIRPVRTDITYAVALHEIGHILDPRGHRGTRLDKEVAAWEWAKANAKEWTDRMEEKMRKSLQSYLAWSMRSKQAKRADTDHPIHTMVGSSSSSADKMVAKG
jgi:hypothetical protein